MIRILHSVSNMDRAGIETMLMNYYRHMDREQIQFDFLCNKAKPGAYEDEIIKLGGRIYRTPGLNPVKYPKYLAYMKKLFDENPQYRIVEAHNGALGVYALCAAKVNHIPVRIFHAHGASIAKDWKLPIKLVCKAAIPANCTHRFSCSAAAAGCYFGSRIAQRGEYEFIPNAIEVERFVFNQHLREEMRNRYGLDGKHVIGHVGRFSAQKNHTFLIDVFEKIAGEDPQAMLVLLGDGGLQTEIQKKVNDRKLGERVLFMGNVGNVDAWYHAFDAFVLPSVWEGLPVVGIEAQANDLPCVFSDRITREVGMLSTAKFLPLSASASHWAKEIMESMKRDSRRDNTQILTERGYNIAVEAKKMQKRYLELYEVNP